MSNFAKKYGLQGKGIPRRLGKRTKEVIRSLYRCSERVVRAGRDWVKTTKWRFGD